MLDWSHIPSLAALRAFEAAARLGSFSAAARSLNVTHAAIAHHVRGLEAEFAEPLMVRQGRGVMPTPAGQRLAEGLQAGFAEIANTVDRVRADAATRPLAIATTPAFAEKWLMPRLGDFWARHPDIALNISPSLDLSDMRGQGVDLSIRFGDGNWPDVETRLLTDGDFWVVARPDVVAHHHELVAGKQVSCLSDVMDLPWVMESHMLSRRGLIEREGVDLSKIKLTVLHTSGLVQSAVLAGLGLTVQPKSLVESLVARGELQNICTLQQPGVGYYMATRLAPSAAHAPPSKALQAFKDWLVESFGLEKAS